MNLYFVIACIIGGDLVSHALATSCFQCNERIAGVTICQNETKVDCNTVFPSQQALCMKTVQKFSSGANSWVFAQCQLTSAFTTQQIDACEVTQLTANNQTDVLETCTCTSDFCNPAHQVDRTPSWVCLSLLLILLWGTAV